MVAVKNNVMEDLFSPYQLGSCKLSHRIVMPSMSRCRAINGIPNETLEKYYTQRSTPCGLLITEGTLIAPLAARVKLGFRSLLDKFVPPHCPGIYTKQQVEAWKKIVDSVHAKHAIIFSQLWHVGQVTNNGKCGLEAKAEPETLLEVIEYYRQATHNAIRAGFDGVEIHAADGYLIDQFRDNELNDKSENREPSLEGITKFLIQVVQAVVEIIGANKVGVRISPSIDRFETTNFNSLDLGLAVVEGLNKLQYDMGSKLAYLHATRPRLALGVAKEYAKNDVKVSKILRDAFEGTFMSSGGYTKDQGMEAVAQGEADLVAYGRSFLSNPDLVHRFKVNAPMNNYVRATFYTQDPILGYIDYPIMG